ncbi:MAG TPA: hypothetical protein VF395_12285 [Polyangiaceae bacterium]
MREQAREDTSDDAFKALSAHNARSRARQERAHRRRRRAALLGAASLVLLLIWLNVALWSGSLHVRLVSAKVSPTNGSRVDVPLVRVQNQGRWRNH